jgi:hypothetical protein
MGECNQVFDIKHIKREKKGNSDKGKCIPEMPVKQGTRNECSKDHKGKNLWCIKRGKDYRQKKRYDGNNSKKAKDLSNFDIFHGQIPMLFIMSSLTL